MLDYFWREILLGYSNLEIIPIYFVTRNYSLIQLSTEGYLFFLNYFLVEVLHYGIVPALDKFLLF